MLSVLYGVSISAINQHIKKIYEDKELEEKSTIKNFLIVQDEGNRKISRNVIHYNLQMIIAVGFKVDAQVVCWQTTKEPKIQAFKKVLWN